VQAGTFALLAPTLSYLNLPEWQCPTEAFNTGEFAYYWRLAMQSPVLAVIKICVSSFVGPSHASIMLK